jgi:hypothetical protein
MKHGFWVRIATVLLSATVLVCSFVVAGYKVKPLPLKPPLQYASHQDFQDVMIGAWVAETQEESLDLFDTKKLYEKDFLPVLIVIQNNNPFPIKVDEASIFLIKKDGSKQKTVSYVDVLLVMNLKQRRSGYESSREELLRKVVKEDMLEDFQSKAFGEREIAPQKTEHGVIFFERPYEYEGNVAEFGLYLPEIVNVSTGDPLVFFEFQLNK